MKTKSWVDFLPSEATQFLSVDEVLAGQAAALFESLLMNHPFVDGKKRVAFFATDVFLRLNGWRLDVEARKANRFLVGLLESHQADFDHLLTWIRESLSHQQNGQDVTNREGCQACKIASLAPDLLRNRTCILQAWHRAKRLVARTGFAPVLPA